MSKVMPITRLIKLIVTGLLGIVLVCFLNAR